MAAFDPDAFRRLMPEFAGSPLQQGILAVLKEDLVLAFERFLETDPDGRATYKLITALSPDQIDVKMLSEEGVTLLQAKRTVERDRELEIQRRQRQLKDQEYLDAQR